MQVEIDQLVFHEEVYEDFICRLIPEAKQSVWIATADLKNMHIKLPKKRAFTPFIALLADLVKKNVDVHLLHAKEPGPRFRKDFDRYPILLSSDCFSRLLCPRVHFKIIVIDESIAYFGSANLTGAGMGAKNKDRRNFEAGIITRDPNKISMLLEEISSIEIGDHCKPCKLRDICPDPVI